MTPTAIDYVRIAADALEKAELLAFNENWDRTLAAELRKASTTAEGVLLSAQDAEYEAHQQGG